MFSPPVKARSWQGSGQKSDVATPRSMPKLQRWRHQTGPCGCSGQIRKVSPRRGGKQWETLGPLEQAEPSRSTAQRGGDGRALQVHGSVRR